MINKIAVTTSSFGGCGSDPLNLLEKNAVEVIFNQQGRTLKGGEVLGLLEGCSGVVAGTEAYDKKVLENLKDLRVISRCGTGIDNVDLDVCDALGIKVFNTPNAPTRAVAELVIGLAFNLLRDVSAMDREIRSGVWKKRMGRLFMDKKVGIIGFGRIGKEVAKLSNLLGAEVVYYDPFVGQESESSHAIKNELEDLLGQCDIISLHLPFSEENKNFLGGKEISLMKENAIFINCSRGGIVDEDVLYAALKNGRLSGAAMDVFNAEPYQGPLQELENVILTPHIGSYAREARLKMELAAADNLIKGLKENI